MWVTKLPDCHGAGRVRIVGRRPRHGAHPAGNHPAGNHPAGNHPAGNLLTRRETLRYHQRRFI